MMRVKKRQFNHNVSSNQNDDGDNKLKIKVSHDVVSTTSACPMHDMKIDSTSEDHSNHHINPSSSQEACPFGAMEASTTTNTNNQSKIQLVK